MWPWIQWYPEDGAEDAFDVGDVTISAGDFIQRDYTGAVRRTYGPDTDGWDEAHAHAFDADGSVVASVTFPDLPDLDNLPAWVRTVAEALPVTRG